MLARLRWHGRLAVPSLSQALALPSLPQCCSHLFAFSAYFVLKERDPLLRGDSSFHPDRQTKRSRGRVARINSPFLVPSLVPILSPSASGHSPAISWTGQGFGTFFLSSRECFPRARSFQTSIREGGRAREEEEEDKEGYFLFRRENKMACLVGSERRRKSSEVFCPPSPRQSQSRIGGRE